MLRRMMAMMLVLLMVFSFVPHNVLATSGEEGTDQPIAEPITRTVYIELAAQGTYEQLPQTVNVQFLREGDTQPYSILMELTYEYNYASISLPIGNYTVSCSDLSVEGYEVDTDFSPFSVTEEDEEVYYYSSVTVYKQDCSTTINLHFADESDEAIFSDGVILTVESYKSSETITLDSNNGWSGTFNGLPSAHEISYIMQLPSLSGYKLSVTEQENCTSDYNSYGPYYDPYNATEITKPMRFEDSGTYELDLTLDIEAFYCGNAEFSLNVTSDEELPAGQPGEMSVGLYRWDDDTGEEFYKSATFDENGVAKFKGLPTGSYEIEEIYVPDIEGFTYEIEQPWGIKVYENETVRTTVNLKYTAKKYGNLQVNFIPTGETPSEEELQDITVHAMHTGSGESVSGQLEGNTVTFENLLVGEHIVWLDGEEVEGFEHIHDVIGERHITVVEGETVQQDIKVEYTAIKYGRAQMSLKFIETDPLPEGEPASVTGFFYVGELDGGMDIKKHTVELTPENNWTAAINLPEGNYNFWLEYADIDAVEGLLVESVTRSCESVTVKQGETANAEITVEYISENRFGDLEIDVSVSTVGEEETVHPENASLILTDSEGTEHAIGLWFDEGYYWDYLSRMTPGEYTVSIEDYDVPGYKAVLNAPHTVVVDGGDCASLNVTIRYEALGFGDMDYYFSFYMPAAMDYDLSAEQFEMLRNSISIVLTDADGNEYYPTFYVNQYGGLYAKAEGLREGQYGASITGYELPGYDVYAEYDKTIQIKANENNQPGGRFEYYTSESSFKATVQFAETSVINAENFPGNMEYWFFGPEFIDTATGELNPENGWTVEFDELPQLGELTFELNCPALEGYVLYDVDVQVDTDEEACSQRYQKNSTELPFTLEHIFEFRKAGSYELVVTLDIRVAEEQTGTFDESFELNITGIDLLGDKLPESIDLVLTSFDNQEYTAEFRADNSWKASFTDLPAGVYSVNVLNYEVEGYGAYVHSDLTDTPCPYNVRIPAGEETIELDYFLNDNQAKVNIQFADESVFDENNFSGEIAVSLYRYKYYEKEVTLSAENGWSAFFDEIPSVDDVWLNVSADGLDGYAIRSISVTETGKNYGDTPANYSEPGDPLNFDKDLIFTDNGSYEVTIVLDIAKAQDVYPFDGTFTITKTFDPESDLQAEDFPDGVKLNIWYPGNLSTTPDDAIVLGPDNNWSHTFQDMKYGEYRFAIDSEFELPGYFVMRYVDDENGDEYGRIEITDSEHKSYFYRSLYKDNTAYIQVNVRFASGSALNKKNFPKPITVLVGGEKYTLSKANGFSQTKSFAGQVNDVPNYYQSVFYGFSRIEDPLIEGYTLDNVLYNGSTHDNSSSISLQAGETETLDILLNYQPIEKEEGKLVVAESFYKESAAYFGRSFIKVYLTDLQGNILDRGVLNEDNAWTWVCDVPDEEGDYIVRQEHAEYNDFAIYSDSNEKQVHLVPGESTHVIFKSDYRSYLATRIRKEFADGSELDWKDFPAGFVLELTDSTGRFTVSGQVLNMDTAFNGGLILPEGKYLTFKEQNADVDGYVRTTTLSHYVHIGGASLRPQAATEIIKSEDGTINAPGWWDPSMWGVINLTNHYSRLGTLTVTNDESFANYQGTKLPVSPKTDYESKSYTYIVKIGDEEETVTLAPGEQKVFKYIPKGTEYSVSVVPTEGKAWNAPITLHTGKIDEEPKDDSNYDQTVILEHDYFYIYDEDGCSVDFVKVDESGAMLSGAKFGIYSDAECTKLVKYVTSDANGSFSHNFVEAGTWYVKEVQAPEGYKLSNETVTVTVTQQWSTETRTDETGEEVIVIAEELEAKVTGLNVNQNSGDYLWPNERTEDSSMPSEPSGDEDDSSIPSGPSGDEDDSSKPSEPSGDEDDSSTPSKPSGDENDSSTPSKPSGDEDDSSTPSEPSSDNGNGSTPQTGDDFALLPMISLFVLSLAGIALLFKRGFK